MSKNRGDLTDGRNNRLTWYIKKDAALAASTFNLSLRFVNSSYCYWQSRCSFSNFYNNALAVVIPNSVVSANSSSIFYPLSLSIFLFSLKDRKREFSLDERKMSFKAAASFFFPLCTYFFFSFLSFLLFSFLSLFFPLSRSTKRQTDSSMKAQFDRPWTISNYNKDNNREYYTS